MTLSRSAIPSDGRAPLGLGVLLSESHEQLDEYEAGKERRDAVSIPTTRRKAILEGAAVDAQELRDVEQENRDIMDGDEEEAYQPQSRLAQAAQRMAFANYSTAGKDMREGKAGGFCEADAEDELRRKAEKRKREEALRPSSKALA